MRGKKGNARIRIAVGALLVCVLAGAATAGAVVRFGSAPSPDAPAANTPTDTTAGPSTADRIPWIGDVVIEHGRYGRVIVDKATGGKQFALAGFQAGECLRYIKANPNPSAADIRAACPGQHGR
jgi:hypothetical protein